MSNNFENMVTPIELLNLYLTDGKSKGNTDSKLYRKFNSEVTWDALLDEGYQQDLAPMLYFIITKPSVLNPQSFFLSDEIILKLKARYNQYLVRSMVQFNELDTILNAFEKKGIDVIPLKGAYIAKEYYPDPALRPMADLDLLVRKEDMKKAKEHIMSLGYEFAEGITESLWENKHFHFPYMKMNSSILVVVELHQDIRRETVFMKSDINEFWRSTKLVNNYKHIFEVSNKYLLLHLFWHSYRTFAESTQIKMLYLLDLSIIIKKQFTNMDWECFFKIAEKWKIQKQINLCISLMELIIGLNYGIKEFSKKGLSQLSLNLFCLVISKINDFRLNNETHRSAKLILNLIVLNIFDKFQYIRRYEAYKFSNKKDRLKERYNLSSDLIVYLFYLFDPIILFFRGVKEILSLIVMKKDKSAISILKQGDR